MNRISKFLLLACCCSVTLASDVAFATLDLRKFGYQFTGSTSVFGDYTDLGFLSEDILFVSINQRSFGPVERTFADSPDATVVVFDIKHGSVLTTGKMSIEKMGGSVQAVKGGRLAVLNERGLLFCDTALQCGPPIETRWPMFVSPQGSLVAVGGSAQSPLKVIEAESSRQVAVFEYTSPRNISRQVIPGDGALLVNINDAVRIQRSGRQDVFVDIDSRGNFPESRFLNPESLACLDWGASEVVVTDMDARPIRRYRVDKAWRTGILPASAGTRFGIYEHGYTVLNSILNFYDIDDARPQDFQRVRVIDMLSGNEVFRLEWDPRPHLIKPALSPSGRRIALVRAGMLEVFQVN